MSGYRDLAAESRADDDARRIMPTIAPSADGTTAARMVERAERAVGAMTREQVPTPVSGELPTGEQIDAVRQTALALRDLRPGAVARGFAEQLLPAIRALNDPDVLWDRSSTLAAAAQKWNSMGLENTELKTAQMFCEIHLAQLLGPNPGGGPGRGHKGAHAHLLPKEIIRDLRRLFGYLEILVEAVRNGKRSRRSLLLYVDELEAGRRPAPIADALDIRPGDFRAVLDDVEPGSVALVLTDPPYPADYLPLWDDLGAWSARHLAEGGSLVAYCGQAALPEAIRRLSPHLRYWWTLALIHGQSQMIPGKFVSAGWKPILWLVRGGRSSRAMLADTVKGGTARKTIPTGDDGSWAQSVEPLAPIISALTAPGDLIVDPFAGSGTVGLAALRYGRRFIGAEVRPC